MTGKVNGVGWEKKIIKLKKHSRHKKKYHETTERTLSDYFTRGGNFFLSFYLQFYLQIFNFPPLNIMGINFFCVDLYLID